MPTTYVIRAFGSVVVFSTPIKIAASIHSQALGSSVVVSQALQTTNSVKQVLTPTSIVKQALTIAQGLSQMPAPNTTIYSTITVTDNTGALVSNLSAVSLVVTFPDSTTITLSLGSGITNIGSGQYQAKYNTKGVGAARENWSVTAADGTTVATYQDYYGVAND